MTNIFASIGILCTICFVIGLIVIFGESFYFWFKNWRRHNCKFKSLCKHTFIIDWIDGHGDMGIHCNTCGKRKEIHFDKESLKTFRF